MFFIAINVGRLNVLLNADTTRFDRNMSNAQRGLESFGRVARNITRVATVAFAGLTTAVALAVRASDEKTLAMIRLESAIEGTGRAIDAIRIREYAEELQMLTGFADSALTEAGALLATFDLTEDQIISLLPRVANLSAMYGIDLNQATRVVGRSLTAGVGALTRYGITVDEATKQALALANEQEKINIMLELFDRNTGPAAERMAQTVSGQFRLMRNLVGDLVASLGRIFEPRVLNMFQAGVDIISRAVNWVENLDEGTRDLIFRWTVLSGAVLGVVTAFGLFVKIAVPVVKGLGAIFSMLGLLLVPKFLIGALIAGIAVLIWTAWDRNWMGIADIVGNFVDGVVGALENLVAWFLATEIGKMIELFWDDIVEVWTDSDLAFADKISETVSLIRDLILDIALAIIPENILEAIRNFWETTMDVWSDEQLSTFEKITRTALALTIPFMEITISLLEIGVGVTEMAEDVVRRIGDQVRNIRDVVRVWIDREEGVSLAEFLQDIDYADVVRRLGGSIRDLVMGISELMFAVFEESIDLFDLFLTLIEGAWVGLQDLGELLADIIYEAFKDEFLQIANIAVLFVEQITDAISTVRTEGARLGRALWESITDFMPQWLRFGRGGIVNVNAFQSGGMVNGRGTGRSDSNLALLSDGEFVINARATEKFLPLLQAINNNGLTGFARGGRVGAYQNGGMVGNPLGGIFPELDFELGALEGIFESVGNVMQTFGGVISSVVGLLGDLIIQVISFITGVDDEELRASMESLKNQAIDLFNSFFSVAEEVEDVENNLNEMEERTNLIIQAFNNLRGTVIDFISENLRLAEITERLSAIYSEGTRIFNELVSTNLWVADTLELLGMGANIAVSGLERIIMEIPEVSRVIGDFASELVSSGAITSDELEEMGSGFELIGNLLQVAMAHPIIAIASLIMALLGEFDEFGDLINVVNAIIGQIVAILSPVVIPVLEFLASALITMWNGLMDIISAIPFVNMDRFKIGLRDLADETENAVNAVADFPRGFRIATRRFEAMIPENNNPNNSPQMFSQSNFRNASAGGNSNMTININAPVFGVNDLERKIAQTMDRVNSNNKMARHGTTQNRW